MTPGEIRIQWAKASFPRIFIMAWILLVAAPLGSAQSSSNPAKRTVVRGGSARAAAWEKHLSMAQESPFSNLEWQRLGPKFAGGRIESIDCPHDDPSTIYAGVGAGGIWKSTNGGLSWTPIFEKESTYAIGDLTIAPSDSNVLWVGTGEAHLSGTSYPGTGVFRSSDAGQTWTHVGLSDSEHIGKVVIDPQDPGIVYVAAMGPSIDREGQRGVYKTQDNGKTFRRTLSVKNGVALVDLVLDPNDAKRLYAAAWDRSGGDASGVYRSEDRGETWKRLTGGLPQKQIGRVAIDASSSSPGTVYALMVDHTPEGRGRDGVGGLLFRSSDYGKTWNKTHQDHLPTYVGWDFCDVKVSPENAEQVYICGLRLLLSEDGGQSFARGGEIVQRLHPIQGSGMHLDMHDLWIAPSHPDHLLLGNDGGLYVSWDRGQTWLHLNNLPIAEFYRVHLDDEQPFQIWGGTQDNASLVAPAGARYEISRADAWNHVFLDPWSGGDGFSTFPAPDNPSIVFYTQQLGDLKRARRGELRQAKRITPRATEGESKPNWAWDTPFFASRHGDRALYCAAQRVFKSTDHGDSWKSISGDLGSSGLEVLVESPLEAGRFAAGGRGGQLYVRHSQREWSLVSQDLPKSRITDIEMSWHDIDRFFVTLTNTRSGDHSPLVFVTEDFAKTWKRLDEGLPGEAVRTLVEDPEKENLLFVGTDLGVYASLDHGKTWCSLSHTLPTAPVVDLALKIQDERASLVAVTHGLSAFLLDVTALRANTD